MAKGGHRRGSTLRRPLSPHPTSSLEARTTGTSKTLMGRYRNLPGINSKSNGPRRHAERAAINTPVQGGAADVVDILLESLGRQHLRSVQFGELM